MPAYTRKLFHLIICLFALDTQAQNARTNLDYGLEFASHEVTKDDRTSLNLNPEAPFHFDEDFEISFDAAYQRLTNAYGYILRIIGNDTLNIDLVSSPEHEEFFDINLIINNQPTALHFNFSDIPLKEFQWEQIVIGFSYDKNEISLQCGGLKKVHSFPLTDLRTFRFYFGANNYGRFKTSDVPPMILKNIALSKTDRVMQKWALKKHNVTEVYDSVNSHRASVKNPIWLLDKHTSWIQRKEFSTSKYPSVAFNSEAGTLYAVDEKTIYTYDLTQEKLEKKQPRGNHVYTDINQLIYVKETGELINYDVHTDKFLRYDIEENNWHHTDTIYHEPEYWHHNKFYNRFDSSVYAFGGYGHFSYKKTFFRYDASAGKWTTVKTRGSIPPRYLGAAGLTRSRDKVYIYGGYGSISGKQQLFPQIFYDLYTFDLNTHQIKKIWEFKGTHSSEDIVCSNSLVLNEKDSCFYVLTFPKNKYESFIKLRQYSLSEPKSTVLPDSIPFRFHDENAFADLFLSEASKELIAVTAHKENDQYKINVYSMNYPPLGRNDVLQVIKTNSSNASLYYTLIGGGLLCISIFYVLFRKKQKHGRILQENEAINPLSPINTELLHKSSDEHKAVSTIYLFGGFQVFDKTGQDITGKFTTTLKEIFVLILLHSVKFEKGISAKELQEHLWPDKDGVSARNNRNVNIKKLRSLLKEVGDVTIENNNAYLHLSIAEDVYCDYQIVSKLLQNLPSQQAIHCENIKMLLANVRRGSLLPNLQTDWLDSFKSDISNQIIDLLLEYSQSLDVNQDSKLLIEIADSIFNYDSINQEALVIKCSVLNKKGKYSLAKTWYEHFAKEYKTLYSENYPKSFEEVIS